MTSVLQLTPAASLDDTLIVLLLIQNTTLDHLVTLPTQGLETLGEMGMREVVACVDGVGVKAAQVLSVQLEKRSGELGGVSEVHGELVGLELVLAGDHVHEQLNDSVHGGEGVVEEEESNNDGALDVETKGRVQRGVIDKDREEGEDVEQMSLVRRGRVSFALYSIEPALLGKRLKHATWRTTYLGNSHQASGVAELPVTELMSQNSCDLVGLVALDQSIVENNVLLPRQTKEVGVGVGAALAAVDDEQLVEGELEAGGQLINLGLELTLWERRELVEQGKDEGRVCGGHKDLKTGEEGPEVEEELVARLLDNLEEAGEDGRQEDDSEGVGLEHVREEEAGRLLVEAILLLQDECVVEARWKTEDLLDQEEADNEDDRVANLAREAGWRPLEEEITGEGP